jgi:hypothetical protein
MLRALSDDVRAAFFLLQNMPGHVDWSDGDKRIRV